MIQMLAFQKKAHHMSGQNTVLCRTPQFFPMGRHAMLKNHLTWHYSQTTLEDLPQSPLLSWVGRVHRGTSAAAAGNGGLIRGSQGGQAGDSASPSALLNAVIQPTHNEVTVMHHGFLVAKKFLSIVVANAKLTGRPADKVRASLHNQLLFAKDRRDNDGTSPLVGRQIQFEDHIVLKVLLTGTSTKRCLAKFATGSIACIEGWTGIKSKLVETKSGNLRISPATSSRLTWKATVS